MSSTTNISRRVVVLAALAALAGGALTAVVVAGASAERQAGIITIRGDLDAITLEGDSFPDSARVQSAQNGVITIVGENLDNKDVYCTNDAGGTATVTSFCTQGTIDMVTAPLGGGDDTISFEDRMKGITVRGDGFGGDDRLSGGPGPQSFDGGKGDDTLEGEAGDDRLRGREGRDRLKGGPGEDDCDGKTDDRVVSGCEH
jgi:Ca2+-binding RTX toxin-like protein